MVITVLERLAVAALGEGFFAFMARAGMRTSERPAPGRGSGRGPFGAEGVRKGYCLLMRTASAIT
ncbi:hypothetical protein BKM31_47700 [[Actinomadura] parvosata subsp. kistnae]|uniref:Uncharacterized protein n=1 Tax=[Actinomadura] parvosata subsp. kistnae TaxID=1909395 RepID=A0A1V0AD60_9ACTN|nr:hypothetical protein BKM31_47700 [Nonomuraea sp. ATCC 55076]